MHNTQTAFHTYFELVDASSEELLREVYRLRYTVFCIEQRIFDANQYPEKMESDAYDRHSRHMLLKHRASDTYIGTVRLILQDPLLKNKVFPAEKSMQIDTRIIDTQKLPRQHFAEISRFALLKKFSRIGSGLPENQQKPWVRGMTEDCFYDPSFALIIGIIQMCIACHIDHLISSMNPALNRLLKSYGFGMSAVGPLIKYYGMRRPYYVRSIDILENLYTNHRKTWNLGTDSGKSCPYAMKYIKASCSS